MRLRGQCYCGSVRFEAQGDPIVKGQCYCRECQYVAGGAPNNFVLMPADGFVFTAGDPKSFTRSDLEHPVTRDFCPECGTHLATRLKVLPAVVVKVGVLVDPENFEPQIAIHVADKQPYHNIPAHLTQFERLPPM